MLLWWAMIQVIALYGWGIGCSALDSSFWWMACSSRSSDRNLLNLTVDLNVQHTRYLSSISAIGFMVDNFEEQHLCGQLGA